MYGAFYNQQLKLAPATYLTKEDQQKYYAAEKEYTKWRRSALLKPVNFMRRTCKCSPCCRTRDKEDLPPLAPTPTARFGVGAAWVIPAPLVVAGFIEWVHESTVRMCYNWLYNTVHAWLAAARALPAFVHVRLPPAAVIRV
jgi:hypothetical protein